MKPSRSFTALLAVLALLIPSLGVAQDEPAPPEGVVWRLTSYAEPSGMRVVPEDVEATLLLVDRSASGMTGCARFAGDYQLDGSSLIIDDILADPFECPSDVATLADDYLQLLATTATWRSSDGTLTLLDPDDSVILEYASTGSGPEPGLAEVLALLEDLQAEVRELRARVEFLESGGDPGAQDDEGDGDGEPDGAVATPEVPDAGSDGGTDAATAPAAPRARGAVGTRFPAWMREGLPPDEVDDRNREIVRWRDRADDEDGYRIFARRGYCELRPGTDLTTNLDDRDFRRARGNVTLVDQLPADTTRYRPDHAAIDSMLPEAPPSPYSNDQFYDLYVAAYNDAGQSRRVLVGSFYLTPEFRCP